MYTGNGVTKKFPIPAGYDGSKVYLIFPTGKSIKMVKDEGYTVSEGAVYFSAAIPAGVVVSFDEPEGFGEPSTGTGYVVIYNDGHIVEVDDDPAEYLAQSQKVLTEAKKHYAEVKEYAEATLINLVKVGDTLKDEVEGILYESSQRGKGQIMDLAELLKSEIRTELGNALLSIQKEAQTVEAGLQVMELLKVEAQSAAKTAAEKTSAEVWSECAEAVKACEAIEQVKQDCKYYAEEAKGAAQKAGLEVQAAMTTKANEELEMLRSLRLRLESDRETLNARIDNAIEVLRSDINGR